VRKRPISRPELPTPVIKGRERPTHASDATSLSSLALTRGPESGRRAGEEVRARDPFQPLGSRLGHLRRAERAPVVKECDRDEESGGGEILVAIEPKGDTQVMVRAVVTGLAGDRRTARRPDVFLRFPSWSSRTWAGAAPGSSRSRIPRSFAAPCPRAASGSAWTGRRSCRCVGCADQDGQNQYPCVVGSARAAAAVLPPQRYGARPSALRLDADAFAGPVPVRPGDADVTSCEGWTPAPGGCTIWSERRVGAARDLGRTVICEGRHVVAWG